MTEAEDLPVTAKALQAAMPKAKLTGQPHRRIASWPSRSAKASRRAGIASERHLLNDMQHNVEGIEGA